MKKTALFIAITGLALSSSFTTNAEESSLQKDVRAAMKLEYRTEADTKRDDNRYPDYALEFFGLKQDMKVIEFAPGNGWYTKILAPVLREKGELHLAYKSEWLDEMDSLLKNKEMNKAVKMPIELEWNREDYRYELGNLDFGMNDADMILNIREYNNFNLEDKTKLNKDAFEALKAGGTYVIVDHSRIHM